LGVSRTKVINLHVEVDEKYKIPRKADDFESLNFLLSGTAGDGRKGQFLAISAFYRFQKEFADKHPERYRNFKLHLVAINDDYVSNQIKWTAESLLGNKAVIYPSLPKAKALEITSKCNAVVCCSLNETFGLYIAEGMLMGHVVLRNNSAGVDEQLEDGKNGYLIDHTDIKQFSEAIAKLLDKTTLSNELLIQMSLRSQSIITDYGKNTYLAQIEDRK
jgi:glycosyltransferase involved in cell wall biosynthesis